MIILIVLALAIIAGSGSATGSTDSHLASIASVALPRVDSGLPIAWLIILGTAVAALSVLTLWFRRISGRLQAEIAERRQSELRLAESASLLEATLESTDEGILVVDTEGKILLYNQRFLSLWGFSEEFLRSITYAEQLAEQALIQLEHPEKFLQRTKQLYTHLDEESFDSIEFKDGKEFERYSKPQKLDDAIIGRVCSFRDVSYRKRTERTLEFQNIILSTQQETSIDGILIVDESNTIISYNQRFIDIFGIPPELAATKDDAPVLALVTKQMADPEGFVARVRYLYSQKEEKAGMRFR